VCLGRDGRSGGPPIAGFLTCSKGAISLRERASYPRRGGGGLVPGPCCGLGRLSFLVPCQRLNQI
jgi:hypothetical protein